MDDGTLLSIFGATQLTAPLTKLIEVTAAGCGVLYEPARIRKLAQAEADAMLTIAAAEGLSREITARAALRVSAIENRRQQCIEAVVKNANSELPDVVSADRVDDDWAVDFFQRCQDVGNPLMQRIWGKLLAGEVTKPGSFSPRTLAAVKTMRQQDAELFTRLCSFAWTIDGTTTVVVGLDSYPGMAIVGYDFEDSALTFDDRLHLSALGLVTFDRTGSFTLTSNDPDKVCRASYFGSEFELRPDHRGDLHAGKLMLTDVGRELVPIAGGTADRDYRNVILWKWQKHGFAIQPEPPQIDVRRLKDRPIA